jgi:cardiolipin synthase
MASSDRDVLLPNALSALRIPLAALLWLAPTEAAWTLSILGLAGTSDVLDGWVARRARARRIRRGDPGALASREARGAWIDGAADKIFVLSALGVVAWTSRPPAWALVALAARELLFVPLMLAHAASLASTRSSPQGAPRAVSLATARRPLDYRAGLLGKLATVAQFAALALGMLRRPELLPVSLLAGVLGSSATLEYALRAYALRARGRGAGAARSREGAARSREGGAAARESSAAGKSAEAERGRPNPGPGLGPHQAGA